MACRHTEGPLHNCEEVERRNALIGEAQELAAVMCERELGPLPPHAKGNKPRRHVWRMRLDALFHSQMEKLLAGDL